MVILVRLLGIIIVIFGVIYLFKPNIIKPYVDFWKKGRRLCVGGILSLLMGVVLLLAASQCKVGWLVSVFGILGLIKGMVLLVLKREKAISVITWLAERPPVSLRVYAFFAILVGTLLIYSA